jgi:fluoride exporter
MRLKRAAYTINKRHNLLTMQIFEQMLFVGTGGFLGANARYILSEWIAVRIENLTGYPFPYGTVFVNVIGSFLLAFFGVWVGKQINLPDNARLLVATGFFGAFTTFSTYANESINLIRDGNWFTGIGNIMLMNVLCLIGVMAGLWIASR